MTRNWSNQNPKSALKTKIEKTKITNRHNTKRTYGQPSEQLFPKRWPLSNLNGAKQLVNTNETSPKLTSKQATENHNRTTTLEPSIIIYRVGWGINRFTAPTSPAVSKMAHKI